METVADLVARGREREGVAYRSPDRTTDYSYPELCTSVWKAGNLLRHYGVGVGERVGVVVGPKEPDAADVPGRLGDAADPLLAILGAKLLGGVADPTPPTTVDGRVLVAPTAWLDRYETAPRTTRLAYGSPPDDPAVGHFERERWSENPVEPPETVDPEAVAVDDGTAWAHGDLLAMARVACAAVDLGPGDRVATDAAIDGPALAGGVLAPLLAGATIVGGDAADVDVRVGPGGDVDPAALTDAPGTRRT